MLFATKKVPLNDSAAKAEAEAEAIDIKDLDNEDLKSLRGNDPFMYYSIPGIRVATIFGKDVDASDKEALCRHNHSSGGQQEPASMSSGSFRSNTVVLRKTRISFEAPMDLEDLVSNNESKEDDEFDVLDALLVQMIKQNVQR